MNEDTRQAKLGEWQLEETPPTFAERVSDKLASFGGSWWFIGIFAFIIFFWMYVNVRTALAFDRYPFILLNLVLSTLAALQAPVIMMSQNRKEQKDRTRAIVDFEQSRQAERVLMDMKMMISEIQDEMNDMHDELLMLRRERERKTK